MTRRFSRRSVLGGSLLGAGTLLAPGVLAACGSTSAEGSGGKPLRFWDNQVELQEMQKDWLKSFSDETDIATDYTYNADPTKMIQALQLAQQSKDLPDIFTNVLALPLGALVEDGWIGEITADVSALPEEAVVNGISSLDGKVYGLPMFSSRVYTAATWFHQNLAKEADIDPANPPATYDDFRAACKRIKARGNEVAPLTMALSLASRTQELIEDQAQAAGFPGAEGVKFESGEYAYDDDGYITAIEFWKSLLADRYVLAGSDTTAAGTTRVKWAAGEAVFFFDGSWNPGGLNTTAPEALESLDVGPILRPGTEEIRTYRGAPSPQYFISANTPNPEGANQLLGTFFSDEYQRSLADNMSNPPLVESDAVEKSSSVPAYKRAVEYMAETVLMGPESTVRNPDMAKVDAELKPVNPTLGDIIQGYLGGSIPDLKKALKGLNDAENKNRDEALKAAKKKGAKVSEDDFAFSDWKPGQDYEYA